MRRIFTISLLAVFAAIACAQSTTHPDNCFTILVGKQASADGSVLMAHNEDDDGEQMVNVYITQPEEGIARYLWCELPKQKNSDAFLNEHGVAVASNYCPSKETRKDYTDGGTVYLVRQTVAQRAHTAREGVAVAAEVVERLGYNDTGRTYLIADATEAWMMSIVRGRHWVAMRVPDDKVMIIPNNYVIDKVNLADEYNFMGSPDLITYAIERGWYDPATDGEFSFKRAYGDPKRYVAENNTLRHLSVLENLTSKVYQLNPDTYPTVFTPSRALKVEDLIDALSNHRSDSETAHNGLVCANTTVCSAVFQLRRTTPKLPAEIANVMWLCIGHPCIEPYIPWYIGMTEAPQGFGRFSSYKEAMAKHFTDITGFRANNPNAPYWQIVDRYEQLNQDWHNGAPAVQKSKAKLQKKIFKKQKGFEKSAAKKSGSALTQKLNDYTLSWYQQFLLPKEK